MYFIKVRMFGYVPMQTLSQKSTINFGTIFHVVSVSESRDITTGGDVCSVNVENRISLCLSWRTCSITMEYWILVAKLSHVLSTVVEHCLLSGVTMAG